MRVVLLYHIEKTGGSAVKRTLAAHGYATFFYGTHHCFEALPWHGPVFRRNASWPDRSKACRKVAHLRYLPQDAKAVVEFHSWSKNLFWKRFAPRQKVLNALHARLYGGSVRSLTMLRDPAAHQRSFYTMWLPRARTQDKTYIRVSYIQWLRDNVARAGLQTRIITGKSRHCDLSLARARLNMLTDVQLLSRLNLSFYCEAKCLLVEDRPMHDASELETRATDAEIALHKAEVERATRCDRRLVHATFPHLDFR